MKPAAAPSAAVATGTAAFLAAFPTPDIALPPTSLTLVAAEGLAVFVGRDRDDARLGEPARDLAGRLADAVAAREFLPRPDALPPFEDARGDALLPFDDARGDALLPFDDARDDALPPFEEARRDEVAAERDGEPVRLVAAGMSSPSVEAKAACLCVPACRHHYRHSTNVRRRRAVSRSALGLTPQVSRAGFADRRPG
jgi:hypothetical protein